MKLVVIIVCAECHRSRQVHIEGPFDILDVKHDCDSVEGFELERGRCGEQLEMAA